MSAKPVHEWIKDHSVILDFFNPRLKERKKGTPTHLAVRNSIREMVAGMEVLEYLENNRNGWNAKVKYLEHEYVIRMLISRSGSRFIRDFAGMESKEAVNLMREILPKNIRTLQVITKKNSTEILFSWQAKKYIVRVALTKAP